MFVFVFCVLPPPITRVCCVCLPAGGRGTRTHTRVACIQGSRPPVHAGTEWTEARACAWKPTLLFFFFPVRAPPFSPSTSRLGLLLPLSALHPSSRPPPRHPPTPLSTASTTTSSPPPGCPTVPTSTSSRRGWSPSGRTRSASTAASGRSWCPRGRPPSRPWTRCG